MCRPKYLIQLTDLHKKIFSKLDEHSFNMILRSSFISKFNAMPKDTRSMYINRITSVMESKQESADYFTGAEKSEYHTDGAIGNDASAYNNEQRKVILNAIYNYTDKGRCALVHQSELFDMLKEFDFYETVDIAMGLGIDVPTESAQGHIAQLPSVESGLWPDNLPSPLDQPEYETDVSDFYHELEEQHKQHIEEADHAHMEHYSSCPITENNSCPIPIKIELSNFERVKLKKEFPKEDKIESNTNGHFICIFKRPTPTVALSGDFYKEFQQFSADMTDKGTDIKAESSAGVYRGNYRKYESESLNSIQREIDILEKRIMQRSGKEVAIERRKLQKYGLFGGLVLVALFIAGKMLHENDKKKHHKRNALAFTKKNKMKYIHLDKATEKNKQVKDYQDYKKEKESESTILQTSSIDYLHPNIIKSKSVVPIAVPIVAANGDFGDTEIVFPSDFRFGGTLLDSLKNHYNVSQYVDAEESDHQ